MSRTTSRRFFLLTAGSSSAAAVGFATFPGPVGAQTATTTLWRLNANWGYPAGPKSRTSCTCKACHSHAANKLFFSQDEAIAGRVHPCCVCQPEALQVAPEALEALKKIAGTEPSVDRRDPQVASVMGATYLRPEEAPPSPSSTTVAPTGDAGPSPLAFTGNNTSSALIVGAGVAGAGLMARRFSRRGCAESSPETAAFVHDCDEPNGHEENSFS